MKKAKILIPAVAALVLSSAAAVTGTVAWFTSTLTADFTNSPVTIVETGGSLTAVATKGIGTTVSDKTITHGTFVDGSVDLDEVGNAVIYKGTYEAGSGKHVGFEVANDGDYAENKQFHATQFNIKFDIDMKGIAPDQTYGLFIDMTKTAPDPTTSEAEMAAGLRVGFKNGTTFRVWAPYNEGTTFTYVNAPNASSTVAGGTYAESVVLKTKAALTQYNDKDVCYLGNFGKKTAALGDTQAGTQISLDVYTWFEGSDPSIVNGNTPLKDASFNLSFHVLEGAFGA